MHVTVVIPAYNAASTLAHTLQSVCAQTHASWDAVVVDDGSRDGTGDIARGIAVDEPRIRVVTQANGGEAAARNRGLQETRRDWVLFLDADDWIKATHLETLTARLAADPTLDAVLCAYARVAGDGTHTVDPYRPPAGDLFPILARRAAFPVHACLVRRTLVDEVGRFDASFQTSADWDLWQRVARTGARFGVVDDVLAFYRMSPKGRSLEATLLFYDGLRILRQGEMADARVPRPDPNHAAGLPGGVDTQQYYLMTWCAGLMLGLDRDPHRLFELAGPSPFPALYPPAIAQILFEAVPLARCETPAAWTALAPHLMPVVGRYLAALEQRCGAAGLAATVEGHLRERVEGLAAGRGAPS